MAITIRSNEAMRLYGTIKESLEARGHTIEGCPLGRMAGELLVEVHEAGSDPHAYANAVSVLEDLAVIAADPNSDVYRGFR